METAKVLMRQEQDGVMWIHTTPTVRTLPIPQEEDLLGTKSGHTRRVIPHPLVVPSAVLTVEDMVVDTMVEMLFVKGPTAEAVIIMVSMEEAQGDITKDTIMVITMGVHMEAVAPMGPVDLM